MNAVCVSWNWLQVAHMAGCRLPSDPAEPVDAADVRGIYLGGSDELG
jgi:hypothetical protein